MTAHRDPGDEHDQLTLPVVAPHRCSRCGAVDPTLCLFDIERADGGPLQRRPRDCINQIDPSTMPFPEGY